jgi:hypothetical protein
MTVYKVSFGYDKQKIERFFHTEELAKEYCRKLQLKHKIGTTIQFCQVITEEDIDNDLEHLKLVPSWEAVYYSIDPEQEAQQARWIELRLGTEFSLEDDRDRS